MLDRPTKHNSDFRDASLSACQVSLIMAMGEYIARGWPVIPLAGKSPLIPWKEFQARLPTVADQKEKIGNGVAAGSVRKVVAYISKIHAVAGEGGHNATFRAACKLRDAGLSKDEALAILSDWNETNATPPWSAKEVEHKIKSAFLTGE